MINSRDFLKTTGAVFTVVYPENRLHRRLSGPGFSTPTDGMVCRELTNKSGAGHINRLPHASVVIMLGNRH
jgi:hypothetical protein